VDGQFIGDVVAVEFAVGGCAAVESDEPDVGCPGERHSGVGVASAADEHVVVVDPQAQVTEDAINQAAGRGNPAALGHQSTLPIQLVGHRRPVFGVPTPNPPSGWIVSAVIPRDRSDAKNT